MTNKLPQGWVECEFGKIFEVVNGDRGKNYPAKNKLQTTGIPFVSAVNIQDGKLREDNLLCLTDEQYNLLNNGKINTEDTLLCIRGSIGKHCRYFKEKGAIASSMVIIRRNQFEVLNSLLHYYLDSHIMKAEIKKYDNGTAQPNLSAADLRKFYFPLPPLNEQKRIVEKIEEEFGKIDEGVEKLKSAQEQIKQYRQSVLKSAFDGKLYKTTEWEEFDLKELCESITAGGDRPDIYSEFKTEACSVPIYSNGIKDNGLYGYTNKAKIEKPAVTVSARGTIGFICVRYKPYVPIVRLISVIPKTQSLNIEFLRYFLNYVVPKGEGSSIPQLTVPNFKQYKIILPTLDEQKQIVKEIEKRFEIADEVERVITENLEKAEQLKQSILKKAFEGRLVHQDPTDQPASELLAKIQAERNK